MLNNKKKSTSGEISQISHVAFKKQILYTQDLKNCKLSRHQTHMNDRHLIKNVFNMTHFTSGPHWKNLNT